MDVEWDGAAVARHRLCCHGRFCGRMAIGRPPGVEEMPVMLPQYNAAHRKDGAAILRSRHGGGVRPSRKLD
ncbi:hypothetical protein GCM10007388_07080 [Pseudoduganella plicata]|uniref:Uncharacterized protein n=1 Tax=Pseudoduganella plicata TaxID=321984 RepID=A0AA88C6T6_9BURK|nr:hypothetical protein GCM10007388_07080 [Pseudoduganella plicata]